MVPDTAAITEAPPLFPPAPPSSSSSVPQAFAVTPPPIIATTPAPPSAAIETGDPHQYLNRELSWLEFNARVLAEAGSPDVPIFERLKFLGIFFSNLDEFFMVRVAGLQAQTSRTIIEVPPDGLTPSEQLVAISQRAHVLCDSAYRLWTPR